jgi:GxxExxY protein
LVNGAKTAALNDLTAEIIGAALTVHTELGPGLLESAYETCLALELAERGVCFERQWEVPVHYKGAPVAVGYRVDLPGCWPTSTR